MLITLRHVEWLAGLLEGEGYFASTGTGRRYAAICLQMTDRDVVERAAGLLGSRVTFQLKRPGQTKHVWRTTAGGHRAIGWMMTLYPLMGERRKAQIRLVLAMWRSWPARRTKRCGADKGPIHRHDSKRSGLPPIPNYYKDCKGCRSFNERPTVH